MKFSDIPKGGPYISIYKIGEKRRFYNPANSFSSTSFKKYQKTLKFLQSKGVAIEIKSDSPKEQRILDE